MTDFVKVASTLLYNGFSAIPVKADKTPAIPSWRQYQKMQMTTVECKRNFAKADRLAVIGGKVSGNLECLDFDDPAVYSPFLELLADKDPALVASLVKRQTPSGGFHLIYRSTGPIPGNLKLACNQAGDVRIETRGEGGYFLTSPSPGYTVLEHGIIDIPTNTPAQVEMIHGLARMFDRRPQRSEHTSITAKDNTHSPGSEYDKRNSTADILATYGWKENRRTTAGIGWTRPGKSHGTSGVLLDNTENFYCWSSNAFPLESGKSYSSFALYTAYEHGGNFTAAARALAAAGYGAKQTKTAKAQRKQEEWLQPLPLIAQSKAAPYPLDSLPGIIGAAVREVVDFVQCPVALGACSALAAISTVTQGLIDVRRADKLEGPTSLFLLAIADSGERKTTVDGFFSKPVQQWDAAQKELIKPDLKSYEAEKAFWEAEKSGLLAAIKEKAKKSKSTEELKNKMAQLETNQPEPPKIPKLLFGDATPEALVYRLAHGWPVGGVLSSEAGTVFGGHAMGKDSAMRNMAMLNSLWGAEPLVIDRKTSPSYTVRGARLTMGLAVQSETIRAFLDSSKGLARGIGWLARFLIAWPESTQGDRMFKEAPVSWPQLAKFHRRLGALLDCPLVFNEQGELQPNTIDLSPEAKAVWVTFHNDVEAELKPGQDMADAKDVASKAADHAARLAALFHLFESTPGYAIGPKHMREAATVVGWHLYEAKRFIGEIALSVELNNAVKLDAWLLGYCQKERVSEVSTTTILQNGPGCIRGKRNLDPALEELTEAMRVQVVKEKRRKMVKVNPALLGGSYGIA